MSFRNFIYYCAICGGWAAFVAWILIEVMGVYSGRIKSDTAKTVLTSALLGLFVGSTIGMLDALLNSNGFQRFVRAGICLVVGMFGGILGGFVGQIVYDISKNPLFQIAGWALVGITIGASIAVFDLQRALRSPTTFGLARRKLINGMIGGTVGGVLGGIAFHIVGMGFAMIPKLGLGNLDPNTMMSPRAVGLVILGMCIGLLIGTAQVVLKEAWIKVESGFRAGREMMLSKKETTIGRAEGTDIPLFGDMGVEKIHAKIVLHQGKYMLVENGSPAGGTFVNGERITGPTPLKNGDLIQLGQKSALRFGERRKSH
ncbi:MAG: hypothetical protein KatS3mg105_1764 [Gemmatales bacterium]|nr:MAG: hypothetical protein KatS3mg105_1764 [Gemmatales bacterium]